MSAEFSDLKFGCVIFDDTSRREQGWKAVGEETSTRVNMQGTASLPTDTIWLTNMDYAMSGQAGLHNNYRFLTHDFLRESLLRMARRYNLTDSRQIAELGAKLLSRSMRLSARLLDAEDDFPVRGSLKNGFRDTVGIGHDPLIPTEMARRLDEATVNFINCERSMNSGNRDDDVVGIFRVMPRTHCLKILNCILPYGEFVEVPKSDLPDPKTASPEDIQAFLEGAGRNPGCFRITCKRFDPRFNALLNFGDSAGASGGAYKRQWVVSPEVVWLSNLSEIVIHQAFISMSSTRLTEALEVADKLPWQADLSVTVGIFFENFWTGMSVRGRNRISQIEGKTYANIHTPFLRAVDRMLLFDTAVEFQQAGFEVLGYNTGQLRVNIAGKDPMEVYDMAVRTDTIPPFLGLRNDRFPPLTPEENVNPLRHMQRWHATSNLAAIMDYDLKVVRALIQQKNKEKS